MLPQGIALQGAKRRAPQSSGEASLFKTSPFKAGRMALPPASLSVCVPVL